MNKKEITDENVLNINRDKLFDLLCEYFNINLDSYYYILTRDKEAFQVGTMTFDDFLEFDEDIIADMVDWIFYKNTIKD